jgi:cytochrome c biogenesis protein CcdA
MIRLIGLVVSIGIADSVNPTTIAPALYLAVGEHARQRVIQFTVAVFLVYFVGGAAIALGPGQLLLSLIPHPDHEDEHVLEIIAGTAILLAGWLLWRHRDRLADREPAVINPEGKSSAILGATITAIELPTAFPYFAAIAAIVGSGFDLARQIVLLLLFNICFVLPLIAIAATLTFAGERAEQVLTRWRDRLQAHWPQVLAGLALVAGLFVILLGVTGFLGPHNRFSRFLHHIRVLLHLHS